MKRYWIVCNMCGVHSVITDPAFMPITTCLGCLAIGKWHTATGVIFDPEMIPPCMVPFGGQIVATTPVVTPTPPVAKKAVHHPFAPKDDWRNQ